MGETKTIKITATELKPCPFCGGNGHLSQREIRFMSQNDYGMKKIKVAVQVICGRCKARGGVATGVVIFGDYHNSYITQREGLEPLEGKAVEYWNRRTEA